ncbi:MAG: hypothetical protein LBV63_01205 [Candidatus Methanoplasma sp.]|jgi:hypothetical protein|nr:hypothetical protein [Candidatus Methanoplasma sp.]
MNKPKRTAQAIFYSVAAAFVIFLATAVIPLSTGGIGIDEPGEFVFGTDGLEITLKGDVRLTSDLPYDVKDVRVATYLHAGDTVSLITDTGSTNVPKGDTVLDLYGRLPVVNALLYSAYASEADAISVPVSLTIQAKYPFSLFGADIRIDADVRISDGGHASITAASDNRIAASFSGADVHSVISNISGFTGTVYGTDVTLSLTKSSGGLAFEIASSGNIADVLTKNLKDNGKITITSSIGDLALDEGKSNGLIEILKLIQEGS